MCMPQIFLILKNAVYILERQSICCHSNIAIVLNFSCSIWQELPVERGRI